MNAILQTDSWVETGGKCAAGPNDIRTQPSREKGGVLMDEIQDKYTVEFTLPYRNVDRYIKEIDNNWNRLDESQRKSIRKSFKKMNLHSGNMSEGFSNEVPGGITCALQYLLQDPDNVGTLLDSIWNPTPDEATMYSEKPATILQIKKNINDWSLENAMVLHSNWKSGVSGLFLILFFLIMGILIGASFR